MSRPGFFTVAKTLQPDRLHLWTTPDPSTPPRSHIMANGITGPPPQTLILEELREQHRGLDQRLRSHHALSRSLIAGAVPAALISFVAWPDTKPISTPLAWLALLILAVLVLMGMIVEDASAYWRDGASIDDLVHRYHQAADMPQAGYLLQLALTMTLSTNLRLNQRYLNRTRKLLALQTYATFAAGGLLFAVLLGLVDVT